MLLLAHAADLRAAGTSANAYPATSPSQHAPLPLAQPPHAHPADAGPSTQPGTSVQTASASPRLQFSDLRPEGGPIASTSSLGPAHAPVATNGHSHFIQNGRTPTPATASQTPRRQSFAVVVPQPAAGPRTFTPAGATQSRSGSATPASGAKPRGPKPKLDAFGQRVNPTRPSDVGRSRPRKSSQPASTSDSDAAAAARAAPVASTSRVAAARAPARATSASATGTVAAARRTLGNGWKRHTFRLVVPATRLETSARVLAVLPTPVAAGSRKRGRVSSTLPSPAAAPPPPKRRKSEPKGKGKSMAGPPPGPVATPKSALKVKGKQRASEAAAEDAAANGDAIVFIDDEEAPLGTLVNRRPQRPLGLPGSLNPILNPFFRPAVMCGGWVKGTPALSKPSSQNSNEAVVKAEAFVEDEGALEAGPVTEANRPNRSRRQATLASQLPPNLSGASLLAPPGLVNQLDTASARAQTPAARQKRRLAFLKDRKVPEDSTEPYREYVMADLGFESTIKWIPSNARDGQLDLARKRIKRAIIGAGPVKAVEGAFPFAAVRRRREGQTKQAARDVLASGDREVAEKERRKCGIRTVSWREAGVSAGRGNARGMAVREVPEGEEGYEGVGGTSVGQDLLKEWATKEPGWDVVVPTTVFIAEPLEEAFIGELEDEEDRVDAEVAAEGRALKEALGIAVDGYDSGVDAEGEAEEVTSEGAKASPPTAMMTRPEGDVALAAEAEPVVVPAAETEVVAAPVVDAAVASSSVIAVEAGEAGEAVEAVEGIEAVEVGSAVETVEVVEAVEAINAEAEVLPAAAAPAAVEAAAEEAMEVDGGSGLEADAMAVLGLTNDTPLDQTEADSVPAEAVEDVPMTAVVVGGV